MSSSSESSSCRIDWRPSRLLCVALAGLGVLGAIAIAISGLPALLKPPLALLALWQGLRLARAEWRQPPCALVLGAGSEPPVLIATGIPEPLAGARLQLRGALATLAWRDAAGRARALRWFADSLPARDRRQLRLRFGGAHTVASLR